MLPKIWRERKRTKSIKTGKVQTSFFLLRKSTFFLANCIFMLISMHKNGTCTAFTIVKKRRPLFSSTKLNLFSSLFCSNCHFLRILKLHILKECTTIICLGQKIPSGPGAECNASCCFKRARVSPAQPGPEVSAESSIRKLASAENYCRHSPKNHGFGIFRGRNCWHCHRMLDWHSAFCIFDPFCIETLDAWTD